MLEYAVRNRVPVLHVADNKLDRSPDETRPLGSDYRIRMVDAQPGFIFPLPRVKLRHEPPTGHIVITTNDYRGRSIPQRDRVLFAPGRLDQRGVRWLSDDLFPYAGT